MSIHYSASLVWGFEISFSPRMVKKIKYDEDTGAKYIKSIQEGELAIIQDKIVATQCDPEEEYLRADDDIWGPTGMEIHSVGYDSNQYVLGTEIATVDDDYGEALVELSNPIRCPKKVNTFGAKHDVVPKLYLIIHGG